MSQNFLETFKGGDPGLHYLLAIARTLAVAAGAGATIVAAVRVVHVAGVLL